MISFLTGKIQNINEKSFTILTSGGGGYKVYSTINTLLTKNIGENIDILIHTVVKEEAIDLYGFINPEELYVFEKLISVSGIGPRSALNMLSVSSTSNIALAIESGDVSMLSGIPGVGKKSCEKIIIELKGKLTNIIKKDTNINDKNILEENDAKLALISLGYSEKDINLALNTLKEKLDFSNLKASEIIKEALKYLR